VERVRLESAHPVEGAVVTVGSFDGLHVGHRDVIGRVRDLAKAKGGTSVVVTFDPHPRRLISPEDSPRLLTTLDEKSEAFERMGIDVLAIVSFTQELRSLTPEAFIDRYLVEFLDMTTVVVGYDHGFGKDRSGDLATFERIGKKRGFEVVSVPPTLSEVEPVSSTRVRAHISLGEIESAAKLLGSGYTVSGIVVKGDGRGREIGFSTANLELDCEKQLPPNGVYAGTVRVGKDPQKWLSAINLGTQPTFDGADRKLEVHILDFNRMIYGEYVSVELTTRLRGEQKYDNVYQLKMQIQEDIEEARRHLGRESVASDVHNRSSDGG